jgi:hypothetical protein
MTDYFGQPINFERRSKDPAAWFSVGLSLHYASNVLWKKLRPALQTLDGGGELQDDVELGLRLRGPFAMLAGLAIENMLKGAIQEITPRAARRIEKTHNLVKLAEKLDLTLSSEEHELLERLTMFVEWAGRYPVALDEAATRRPRLLRSSDYLAIMAFAGKLVRTYHHGQPLRRAADARGR